MGTAGYELRGDSAVITIDSPPVNSLGHDVRQGIVAGLARAHADPAVTAIVLTGRGGQFSAGADIREFGTSRSAAEPNLAAVIRMLEDSPKPVVAAINGACMGGGLELALGAHYRVAAADASIALPEVKLGLLPGAGGTQRLPRLIGPEAAVDFIISGNPLPAVAFKGKPLFDEITEADVLTSALAFATRVVGERRPLQRVRDLTAPDPLATDFFEQVRTKVRASAGRFPAPLKCVDAVEAACTLPFDDGLKLERELFVALVTSPESRALRHAFQGERAASKIPDVPPETPTRSIATVGVVGAGTMGGGIAMNFANVGIPVRLLEMNQAALDRGIATIKGNYERALKKGGLTPTQFDDRMALIRGTLSYDDLRDCDLIIEAVFEELGVKETVFRKLDEIAKPGAILASNTSTLDLNRIAEFTRRPSDVVGMHFFSPANVMRLLEVVRGEATAKDVLATVMQLAKMIRKTAVVAGVCDGFIGNRMLAKYTEMAGRMLVEGAMPWQVDRALEKWGMAMGPFRVGDLAGNDISWAIRKRRYVQNPPKLPVIADRLCERGRFGQKVGRGWYRYEAGSREAIPDPEVEAMIEDYRREVGVVPRAISDEEIVQRCIYALVNEGARILEDGIAARASDIDIIYLTGYGFPRFRGGPMLYADEVGLANIGRTMAEFAAASGDPFWTPAALIERRLAEGKTLT
jgi:3-hydroxyacyl-CoA dehydrogenase